MPDGLRSPSDFPYAAAVREHARLLLGKTDKVMDMWTLREWIEFGNGLVDALETCGAAVDGARDAWDGHWDRFISLLDSAVPQEEEVNAVSSADSSDEEDGDGRLELTPAQEAGLRMVGLLLPTSTPEERTVLARQLRERELAQAHALVGLYDDEGHTVPDTSKDDALLLPLPWAHGGRRLTPFFFSLLEMRFRAYQARFDALAAFEAAVQESRPVMRDHLRPKLHAAEPHAIICSFLEWMRNHQDSISQRFLREEIGNPMAKAHLRTGEVERYILQRVEEAGSDQVLNERPPAMEVLKTMRQAAFRQVDRFLERSGEQVKLVVDGFLRVEALANKEWRPVPAAHDTERLALLLLPNLLDAALSRKDAKHRIMECSWIDELKQEAACGPPLFTTPAEAVAQCPEAQAAGGVMLVRLLRRTFVLYQGPTVLEVPTFSAGLLLVLSFLPIEEKKMPRVFREHVRALRGHKY